MTEGGSLRASDDDREAVTEVLRQAHAEGRLDYAELDERLSLAYRARTQGELDRLTLDLPRPDRRHGVERARDGGQPARVTGSPPSRKITAAIVRASWYVYAVAVGINLLIWAVVSLSNREWIYFWPIWVAGPWGIVLLAGTVFGRHGGGRDR